MFLFVMIGPVDPALYLPGAPAAADARPTTLPPRAVCDASRRCMWRDLLASRLIRRGYNAVSGALDDTAIRSLSYFTASLADVCVCPGAVSVAEEVERFRALGVDDDEQLRRVGLLLRDVAIFEGTIHCPKLEVGRAP